MTKFKMKYLTEDMKLLTESAIKALENNDFEHFTKINKFFFKHELTYASPCIALHNGYLVKSYLHVQSFKNDVVMTYKATPDSKVTMPYCKEKAIFFDGDIVDIEIKDEIFDHEESLMLDCALASKTTFLYDGVDFYDKMESLYNEDPIKALALYLFNSRDWYLDITTDFKELLN